MPTQLRSLCIRHSICGKQFFYLFYFCSIRHKELNILGSFKLKSFKPCLNKDYVCMYYCCSSYTYLSKIDSLQQYMLSNFV